MRCPACLENFNASEGHARLFDAPVGRHRTSYSVVTTVCSNETCGERIIFLESVYYPDHTGLPPGMGDPPSKQRRMILPRSAARPNVVLADVSGDYADDYQEAVSVLDISPKASAALSRRVLQNILREEAKVPHSNLSDEIGTVVDAQELPSRVITLLDAVREVGNFAAHPIKSTNSGEIVNVEAGEAELNLDVLEMLFDYYFTAPKLDQKRLDAINAKLTEAGKNTISETIAARQAARDKKKLKEQEKRGIALEE